METLKFKRVNLDKIFVHFVEEREFVNYASLYAYIDTSVSFSAKTNISTCRSFYAIVPYKYISELIPFTSYMNLPRLICVQTKK